MRRTMAKTMMWTAVAVLIAVTFSAATSTASANIDTKIQPAAIVQTDTAMTSASFQHMFTSELISPANSNTAVTVGNLEVTANVKDGVDAVDAFKNPDIVNLVLHEMRHKTGMVGRIIMPMAINTLICT